MRIFRYIIRETFKAQIAVFLVLLTIFVSQQFVQVLAQASEGQLPAQLIIQVLGLQLPSLAALILPISLFLGILLAHGRLYADHEMAVLHACGVSEWYVARATLAFALVVAVLTAFLTMWIGPWALSQEQAIADRARAEAGVSVIQTGRFQQVAQQRAVIFVERQNRDGLLEEIFVAQLPARSEFNEDSRASVVMAAQGRIETLANGSQQLILDDGRRYSQSLVNLDHHVMSFDQYQLQVREQELEAERRRQEAVPTAELLQMNDSESVAEFAMADCYSPCHTITGINCGASEPG